MKRDKFVSPVGIFVYPHLNDPDRQFDPTGLYHVRVRAQLNDPTVEQFLKNVTKIRDAAYKADLKNTGKKKLNQNALPWKDDAENDGEILINFKLRAKVTARSGDTWEQRPNLFDAGLKPTNVRVGSGSEGRVSGEVNPYCTPAGDTGVTLWCKSVQIITLVEYGVGGDHGFSEVDGFASEDLIPTENNDFVADF